MKVKLRIGKKGATLYEGVHEVIDQESFAAAFASVWQAVRQRRLEATTSVGELMDDRQEVKEGSQGSRTKGLHGEQVDMPQPSHRLSSRLIFKSRTSRINS